MNNKGTISIIVAVYNAENYLQECCASILNQTYKNLQLILINDGSKDSSINVCKRIAEKDSRVLVIDKENGGCFSAWNAGLERATGDYIGFVDNDDYIAPQMYEILINLMMKYNADIATCDRYRNVDNNNDYQNMDTSTTAIHEYSGYEATLHLLSDTKYLKPAVWDKLYKRELFDNICFPNTFFEDAAVSYKLLFHASKVVTTEKQLYAYRVHNGSMITTPWSIVKTKSYLDVTNGAISYFEALKDSVLTNAAIYWQLQFGIEAYERLLMSKRASKEDFNIITQSVQKNYLKLNLKELQFDTKKYIKKKIEFALFTACPKLLFGIKKKELR